ncbi:MAG: 2-oxoacid:acceptor oxidoreductase subunit alpha [Candidatus Aminicenantes bacterium]|nr:2-oxoacid:acceptor oxidoreductase subunit alpha [Candidatus Aminicenantes bacterium]
MSSNQNKRKDVSIVICGAAGQGIKTVEKLLVHNFSHSGFHVFSTKEYMSRVRGGTNSVSIRVSSQKAAALKDRIDILLPLHSEALGHLEKRISSETIVIGDKEKICKDCPTQIKQFIDVPLEDLARDIGGKIFINIIAAGIISGILKLDLDKMKKDVKDFFSQKDKQIVEKNIQSISQGYSKGEKFSDQKGISFDLTPWTEIKNQVLINGAEAVGFGALAGGCDFLSSYPMSPSTGVLVFISQHAHKFEVAAEQAEDEISAINMALGASYAGARSLVTTSGGGLALMGEGISLAGMIETPVVIHVAQRPGPATGLPTRTEQGDLELVLHAGHGEFPRIILAPGSLEDAFSLTQKAFDLADKFQIPVFILTDQFFMDSYYNIPAPDFQNVQANKHIIKTENDYKRSLITKDGISPRGIPGYGEGLVGVDSDEHDESSHITEDLDLRTQMAEKRLKKMDQIKKQAIPPELVGPEDYRNLIIGWGSTLHVINEALDVLGLKKTAFLHFKQVYPLPDETKIYLEKADQIVIAEHNATSQFKKLIKLETGIDISKTILKYNGLAFSVEEMAEKINHALEQED